MAKILLIGDPHLKITKFELAQKFLSWINFLIIEEKPDLVVNLGDTFDTHAVLRSEVMSEFMEHVKSTLKTCPYIYVIGNHDQYKPNDNKYHALSHLKNTIKDFTIIDEITDIGDITYVPYVHDQSLFPKKTKTICIAHQTFKGADYGSLLALDGIDPSTIDGAELIISGHIHKKQDLQSSNGNIRIVYPGTPFSQSASDVDQIKGISIFDTDTFNFRFVQSPMPMWYSINFEYSDTLGSEELHLELAKTLNNKDNWVIEIIGPKTEIVAYLDSKEYKSLIKDKNIKLKTKFNDKNKKKIKITATTIKDIVDQYIDKVYSGNLDKETLKIKAKQIMATVE